MPNTIIFLAGTFVTVLWGSVVGALIYAAMNPSNSASPDNVVGFDKKNSKSDIIPLKQAGGDS
jgi:hypothetical protein